MKKINIKKLIILNIPYVIVGLVATNIGEAFRIAGGTNASEKLQSVILEGYYWHVGAGTLVKSGEPDEGCLQSPGTMHCGTEGVPFCSEAWDAISRYIYTGLQGGSIMKGWMREENTMICCCNDGTRPVIFKIERIDYE